MRFYWPVTDVDPTKIAAGYKFGVSRGSTKHPGLDVGTLGDIVTAAAAGTVSAAGWAASGEGGVLVYIDHDTGWQTRYFHLDSKLAVKRGDKVRAGTELGTVSNTGIKNSPAHLHFEIRYKGKKPPKYCTTVSSDGTWYLCNPEKLLRGAVPLGLVAAAITVGYLLIRRG